MRCDGTVVHQVRTLIESVPCDPAELAPDVPGMTSPKVRWLLNAIVSLKPGWAHLEVGAYKGATFISALLNNVQSTGVVVEDYSEYDTGEELRANLTRYRSEMGRFQLVERDFFAERSAPETSGPFDSVFYDGAHSLESQRAAVIAASRKGAPEFVLLVDDWNWENVRRGTWEGIEEMRPAEVAFWEMPSKGNWDRDLYHNGLGVFVLRKTYVAGR